MSRKKQIYLTDLPLDQAIAAWERELQEAGKFQFSGTEMITADEHALKRVLAQPVWAKISSPHYYSSAMDGFAVKADQTEFAVPASPVLLRCIDWDGIKHAEYLDTGDPLPDWADAVIPIENVESCDESGNLADDPRKPAMIRIRHPVHPWEHVRSLGEDIVATQLILPEGHQLRPVDLGAILASGNELVTVNRRPVVAIIPTGSELVTPGKHLEAGDILEFNSIILAAQVNEWGGIAVRYPITPDNFEIIHQQVQLAANKSDLVLLIAGSSAGSEDYSSAVIESLGKVLVHGIAVRPGHPVILGMLAGGVPVIGIPGYPVSATLTGEIFVQPLLKRWSGSNLENVDTLSAVISRKISSPAGDDEYLRVVLGRIGERLIAAPLTRGAGIITSLVKADGIVVIPKGIQGLQAGSPVEVRAYRKRSEIEKNILITGSHDLCLDLLAQFLSKRNRHLVSANVGSVGGLIALRRDECHLAGSHLLDADTGRYNIPFISKYLPGERLKVLEFVYRVQGMIVARGNPKGIRSLEDITRSDVTFVNRQKGAGTRVLLDYHLAEMKIRPEVINNYAHEEYTHLAVAAAVSSGRVDCGMGIAAAANALGLDFVPLFEEKYELFIKESIYTSSLMEPLLVLLNEKDFRIAAAGLPGYRIGDMGKIVFENGFEDPTEIKGDE